MGLYCPGGYLMLINTCFSIDGARLSVYSQTFLFSIEEQGSPNTDLLCLYGTIDKTVMQRKIDEDQKNFLVASAW